MRPIYEEITIFKKDFLFEDYFSETYRTFHDLMADMDKNMHRVELE